MNEHYAAVVADLRSRRQRLEAELKEVDTAMLYLQRLTGEPIQPMGSQPSHIEHHAPKAHLDSPEPSPNLRYANMSVRWGVLWYLAEFSEGYAKTSQIADALVAGGYRSKGESRFANMVSAVISGMKVKGEVESSEEGYRISEGGRRTWNIIRHGVRFREAVSSTEPTLLSVQ